MSNNVKWTDWRSSAANQHRRVPLPMRARTWLQLIGSRHRTRTGAPRPCRAAVGLAGAAATGPTRRCGGRGTRRIGATAQAAILLAAGIAGVGAADLGLGGLRGRVAGSAARDTGSTRRVCCAGSLRPRRVGWWPLRWGSRCWPGPAPARFRRWPATFSSGRRVSGGIAAGSSISRPPTRRPPRAATDGPAAADSGAPVPACRRSWSLDLRCRRARLHDRLAGRHG